MFSTKAHTEPTKLEYRICKCLQLLGLIIDLHLTWENHTTNMSNKCLTYVILHLNPAPSKLLCNSLGISMQ